MFLFNDRALPLEFYLTAEITAVCKNIKNRRVEYEEERFF
jgi:hypothetical protein